MGERRARHGRRPARAGGTRSLAVPLAVATAVFLGGCSDEAALPPAPAEVRVTMDDYEFTHDVTIPGGRAVFRFRNTGSVDQEVVLVALPTDLAPLRQQLASDERLAVETIAVLPARPPGRRGMFAVDLAAGRYELVCFVMDADGRQ